MVENIFYYVVLYWEMSEIEFVNVVFDEVDCDLLLDVNNLFVNVCNYGYDVFDFFVWLLFGWVVVYYVVGYYDEVLDLKIDIYGVVVKFGVWVLFGVVYCCFGVCLILFEWDFNYLLLGELLLEVE